MEKVTDATWDAEVLQADQPVVVDFGATWCGPCKKLDPLIEQLEQEYAGRVKVRKVDVGEAPQVAQRYRVLSVPRVLFFKGGEVRDQVNGLLSKDKLAERFANLLDG
ncbi:MAG: Thioredoxin 1 [Calditrichaeota bacterium]|nr:Thioredoxin 1 [Calditrichota bacterium]